MDRSAANFSKLRFPLLLALATAILSPGYVTAWTPTWTTTMDAIGKSSSHSPVCIQQSRMHIQIPRRQQKKDKCVLSGSSTDLPDYLKDDIARLKTKASSELQKAKMKLEIKAKTQELNDEAAAAKPFFASIEKVMASSDDDQHRRKSVIKAIDEATGLITADGEKMAALSEKEEWQLRSLLEVFENELQETDGDVYSLASQQLAQKDVAASIWNLRKQLQTEDFHKIFDRKNRFIGETE